MFQALNELGILKPTMSIMSEDITKKRKKNITCQTHTRISDYKFGILSVCTFRTYKMTIQNTCTYMYPVIRFGLRFA